MKSFQVGICSPSTNNSFSFSLLADNNSRTEEWILIDTVDPGQFSSVQFNSSIMSESLRPDGLQHTQASQSITSSWSLLKLMSIELVIYQPLLLPPSIFPSIRVFSNESVLHIRQPKYWSFNFSISSSNEYSGLISFRIDWFDFLAVQGTLKSLLQLFKVSILQHSAFFMVQLTSVHDY